MSSPSRTRPRLRIRAATAFALLALLLSVSLSFLTFQLARRFLLNQREDLAVRQAVVNAGVVRSTLSDPDSDVRELLVSLDGSSSSRPLLQRGDDWFAATVEVGRESVPGSLQEMVSQGTAGVERIRAAGVSYVAIGVPLPGIGARYYEFAPLTELSRTLRTLAGALAAAAVVTTLVGAAAGWWASGRVIRPLSDVASAARAISLGDLETRLPDTDRDLTALTVAFNDMATALEGRIERETRFTSDVSHELRTPLTAITSAVQLAQRSEDPDRTRLALEVVSERVERLRKLVLDLLEISRFDLGAVELDVQPTDVVALVAGTAESVGVRDDVIVDETDGDGNLLLDRRRIDRVLANLLVNSQQYGGGPTQILVRVRNGDLMLAVDDAGPGVSPEERAAIFGRFHRGRAANSADAPVGTGLGLAIAEEHVHFHGGTIRVEASSFGGARFVVRVPAVRP